MPNPFEQCRAIVHGLRPLAERYLGAAQASQLQEELDRKVDAHNIEIMLFGAYNAGKSTLLNALLGRHEAAIADIPTTDRVDRYDWDGYVLLDTPGVNAPIAHEALTQRQLARCDLVMLVIREGDQDTRDVYDRLFELLAAGKKVFVVLNYQDKDALPESFERVTTLLSTLGQERKLDPRLLAELAVLPVNADSALRGRTENKAKLLAGSGYPVLLSAFQRWLEQYDSDQQRLSGLVRQVGATLVEPLLAALAPSREAGADGGRERLSASVRDLERRRDILRQAARNKVRHQLQLKRGDIGDVLSSAAAVPEKESRLAAIAGEAGDAVQQWLAAELEEMRVQVVQASFDAAGVDMRVTAAELDDEGLFDLAIGKAKDGLKGVDKEHIKDLLLWGRKLRIPGMKGRWGRTLDKWAGRMAPGLQVVLVVVDLFLAWRGQEKHNERQLQEARRFYAEVDRIVDVVSGELNAIVDEVIAEAMDRGIAPLQEKLDAEVARAGELAQAEHALRAAEGQLAALRIA